MEYSSNHGYQELNNSETILSFGRKYYIRKIKS